VTTPEGRRDRGPGVAVPPPAIVGALLLLAWLLHRALPMPLTGPLPLAGPVVMAIGAALAAWALALMLRASTDPRPDRPDRVLIESGPFRFSRNPIYLGILTFTAGLALGWGSLWGWLAVVLAFLALDRLVVPREERYLRQRFGAAYEAYAARVRRWV
jgi:protein-S-isoprenylcysteine O-methyltransferase Ste14